MICYRFDLKRLAEIRSRVVAGIVLVGVWMLFLFWGIYHFDRPVFHEADPYGDNVYQVLWRLFFYLICTVNILATMSLIPRRHLPYISEWGKVRDRFWLLHTSSLLSTTLQCSMYPFLFQQPFIRLSNYWCGVVDDVKERFVIKPHCYRSR